jgi:hypothetical protein
MLSSSGSKSCYFKICSSKVCNDLSLILICTANMKLNWIFIHLFIFFLGNSTYGFHSWEEHYFFDVVGISQEHGNSINSASPTSCWWKTVFQSSNEICVDMLGFKITSIFGGSLTLESSKLNLWVIELSVSVNNFVIVAEQFKSL